MDAEHRHELKTNELADWIGHFPDFCRENAKTIIGVSLIIAAAVVFFYSRGVRAKSQFDQEAQAIALINRLDYNKIVTIRAQREGKAAADSIGLSAESLEMAAAEAKLPHVAALLLIKQGDALRTDLHYRAKEVDPDVIGNQINNAREAYEKALIQAQGNNTLVALANFGMGMCAEEIGDYTKAAKIYDSIIADADFAGTVLPRQAQGRLDNMEDNKMQFIFVAAPLPKPEIKIESPTPKPVVPDAPKPDANGPGAVEIKPAGEDTATPVAPVTEEPGPALPDTSKTGTDSSPDKEPETN
ncbi:MAG: hypothetical protein J7M40_00025 [Planctomycetes bacterium]|nr:hypothetical protein [Planctomycetota bacterium]